MLSGSVKVKFDLDRGELPTWFISFYTFTICNNFLRIHKMLFPGKKELFSKLVFSLHQHRDTQETLAVLDRLDLDTEKPSEEDLAKKFGYEEDYFKGLFSSELYHLY